MKILVFIIFCFMFFLSCKKENDKNRSAELNGNWELRIVDGGFSYQHTIYPAGNGNTVAFSGTNQYQKVTIINGEKIMASGNYSITRGSTCVSNGVSFITFSGDEPADATTISVSGDSLYLKANNCIVADGVDRTYVKINN